MTAKEWLKRGWRIEEEIRHKKEMRQNIWDVVTSVTPNTTADVVSGTANPHKFDRITELDDTIDSLVDKLLRVQYEIVIAVNRLPDRNHRILLERRYVKCETWEKIAVGMGYSYRQVTRMHGRALAAFGELCKDVLECPMR